MCTSQGRSQEGNPSLSKAFRWTSPIEVSVSPFWQSCWKSYVCARIFACSGLYDLCECLCKCVWLLKDALFRAVRFNDFCQLRIRRAAQLWTGLEFSRPTMSLFKRSAFPRWLWQLVSVTLCALALRVFLRRHSTTKLSTQLIRFLSGFPL